MEINYLLIVVIILIIIKMAMAYDIGMVKEIISVISWILVGAIFILIAAGLKEYMNGDKLETIIAIILIGVIGAVKSVITVVLFPAKVIAKLPIVHQVDKICGVVIGAVEVIVALWVVYGVVMVMNLGTIEVYIMKYTNSSQILSWLYQHNIVMENLSKLIGTISTTI